MTTDNLYAHLTQLQNIAKAKQGHPGGGYPGFEASIDYVVSVSAWRLRRSDIAVSGPAVQDGLVALTVAGAAVTAKALEYPSPPWCQRPAGSSPVDDSPGCSVSDYDRLPVAGAVVVVDRGVCPFAVKEAMAAQRGAVDSIVADNVDEPRMAATLGQDSDVKIPVVGVSKADGAKGPSPVASP